MEELDQLDPGDEEDVEWVSGDLAELDGPSAVGGRGDRKRGRGIGEGNGGASGEGEEN